jgi:hypothetical protein
VRIWPMTASPPPNPVRPSLRNDRKIPPRLVVLEILLRRLLPYRKRARKPGLSPLRGTETIFRSLPRSENATSDRLYRLAPGKGWKIKAGGGLPPPPP